MRRDESCIYYFEMTEMALVGTCGTGRVPSRKPMCAKCISGMTLSAILLILSH